MKNEFEDFNNKAKKSYIDNDGMINLGVNKVHVSSPFGRDLMRKYPHLKHQLKIEEDLL